MTHVTHLQYMSFDPLRVRDARVPLQLHGVNLGLTHD